MRILTSLSITALMLATAAIPAPAGASRQAVASAVRDDAAIRAELAAILADAYDVDGPGGAVIVTKGGRTIFHAARGMADIEAGRRMVPTERYFLASISKAISAATVASLAEDGLLSLDDPIGNHVGGFNPKVAGATIRQLLNHTSGITDITKQPGWIEENKHRSFSSQQIVDMLSALPAKSEPGERFEYNNSGYMLLGVIIEKVTGKPWTEAMATRVAGPLGLTSLMENEVTMVGYDGPDASAAAVPAFEDKGIAGAAGGLSGSLADLATFANALYHEKLLGAEMTREALAMPRLASGEESRYGFGFRIGQLYGGKTYFQGGAMDGVRTEMLYVPEGDVVVAVFANSTSPKSQPRALAERMAAAAMGRPFPIFVEEPLDIARAKPMIGTYEVEGRKIQFLERDGKLWFAAEGSSALPVTYFGERRFFFEKERGDWFEFVRGPDGGPMLRFHDAAYEEPVDARRIGGIEESVVIDPGRLAALVGAYRMETDVVVHVEKDNEGKLTLRQDGKEESMPLRALDQAMFAVDGTPMKLEFIGEGSRVEEVKLYRGAREMTGRRVE
ncbi:serine hydrolase domain-containing protein [Sphingomicrobium nitratireducens]|uniref:serine hydrolase domain-containing protein n=1 Tax=Sphingomicrobium nitratireducens TaxID=2964666 RepID=UPI00223F609D|nr:serine hydrolase domain-containing protein [Sphingomicrobium nitratireducens]